MAAWIGQDAGISGNRPSRVVQNRLGETENPEEPIGPAGAAPFAITWHWPGNRVSQSVFLMRSESVLLQIGLSDRPCDHLGLELDDRRCVAPVLTIGIAHDANGPW